MRKSDRYACFADLAAGEEAGRDYAITVQMGRRADIAILAPHGGGIEPGTSLLARAIAGEDYSLYLFEGIKQAGGNGELHITSHHFDEPQALTLLKGADTVVAIHGCRGEDKIFIGGRDGRLSAALTAVLLAADYNAVRNDPAYLGQDPNNICNRGAHGKGAQLELTLDLRQAEDRQPIAAAVRQGLSVL